MNRVKVLAVLALLSAACSATDESSNPVDDVFDPGRIVVVDSSGDVVAIAADGSDRVVVAEAESEGSVFAQPIWSPDGETLAWGQAGPDGFTLSVAGVASGERSSIPMTNLPFYSSWSPDGGHIGVLHNGSNGIDFVMVDVEAASAEVVGQAAPFYFSWSPDSDEVAVHAGGDRFDAIEITGSSSSLGPTDAGYLAPQWTDDGIVHVVDGELVLRDLSGEARSLSAVGDFALFVANRQATRIALQDSAGDTGLSVGLVEVQASGTGVRVVDTATGDSELVTESPAVGFFWSPDGEALLILEPEPGGLQASVWSDESGLVDYEVYVPTSTVAETMLPFFPQYAQSVSFWSPGSDAFVYAADDGVWIQELVEAEPRRLTDGSWAAWSK